MKNFRNVFAIVFLLVVSIFALFPSNAFAERAFSSAVNYAIGSGPQSVTSGDFNKDGNLDLAVANVGENNVSILLGVGDGSFGSAQNYVVGSSPHSVTSGDFDKDGDLDLAVANYFNNNVSILLGVGNGSFGSAQNYAVGIYPSSVTSGDFNKDGNLDLAIANTSSNNVSILLGVGNGSFGSAVNYIVGTGPLSVTSDDFDKDGDLDLAVANESSNNVSILLGVGNGSFGSAQNYAAGTHPSSVISNDFNKDGNLDLAVANYSSNNVSILLGVGNGSFGSAQNYAVGTSPCSITSGDFDGDTYLDLAVLNNFPRKVSILLGVGDGSFGIKIDYVTGDGSSSVTTGLFNNDAYLDLAVANWSGNNVSILLNIELNTPSQITDLSATPNLTSITLSWSEPDDGNSPITGYKIERESPIGGGFSTIVPTTGNTNITYNDTNLTSSTEYNYKVSAINAIGTGTVSDQAHATTLAEDTTPSIFSFTDQTNISKNSVIESNSITVSGINTSTPISISSCTGTSCEYSKNSGAYTSSAGTVVDGDIIKVHQRSSDTFNTTTDLTLDIGTVTDTFSVTTLLEDTAPSQITDLSATPNLTSITLSWTEPDDGNSSITGYKIERESPIGGGFTTIVENTGNTDTSYTDQGLKQGTEYNYKVSAINTIGTGTASNEANATTGELLGFTGGDGSETNPFQISTCQQLQDMNYTADDEDTYPYLTGNYYFILNNNIDCSATRNWNDGSGFMPIGTGENIFIGDFNGNNKVISGLYINRPEAEAIGLFGAVGTANIYNVGLADVNVTGGYYVGGLVGGNIGGQIENTYTTGTVTGIIVVGGLVGYSEGGQIENTYTTGTVIGILSVGGLVGYSTGQIFNSYSTANVTGDPENLGDGGEGGVGGLVGDNMGGHIENTYATGNVTGSVAGGLVGTSIGGEGLGDTTVNSYATGSVSGSIAGGLVGYDIVDNIYNSYATGDITGIYNENLSEGSEDGYFIGGLIGGLLISVNKTVNDYIFNSGWYQSPNNLELSGIGMFMTIDGNGGGESGPTEVSYPVTDNKIFYDKNFKVYDLGQEGGWTFEGNPWYEQSKDYPKFTKQEKTHRGTGGSRGGGTSPAVIASFQLEQQQRAINAGLDPTPYQTGTSTSSPNQEQQPPLSSSRILKLTTPRMQGDDVKSLQTYLNTHGYDCGTPDGTFGLKTKQAVIAFQLANGLKGDGVVGILTKGKMQ